MAFPAVADDLAVQVCKALDIDPEMVRRVVIDLEVGNAARVFVEMWGDKKLLDVQWNLLHGVVIAR